MKILVVIANYGTKNDGYLRVLLDEYRSMRHDVHVVVLTNVPKDLGADVEVKIDVPRGDPWGFPFAHKQILADRHDEYDLFIYSEDDTLITQRNIDSFVAVTAALPADTIAGFIRSERAPDGTVYFSTAHAHFHWDPQSVVSYGPYCFAFFTNEHSGSYILTRDHLARAIQSGGFLVGPHQGKYHLPETAATDPYTQCGFTKMICFSHIDDFTLPHLPCKYIGKLGTREITFRDQISALASISANGRCRSVLFNGQTRVGHLKWSRDYYERASPELMSLIPAGAKTVLSYGCGSGEIEADMARNGIAVTAAPMDSVIGFCVEARGVEVVYGDSQAVCAKLSGRQFDCVVLSNMLHLVPEPEALLSSLSGLLSPHGTVVASVPNLARLSVTWRRLSRNPLYRGLGSYVHSGLHLASLRRVRRWFARADLRVVRTVSVVPERHRWPFRFRSRLTDGHLAEEFSVLARRA